MSLKDDSFTVFHAGSGRFADNDISHLILNGLKAKIFTKLIDKFPDLVFVFGWPGNPGQTVKMAPQCRRAEVQNVIAHIKGIFCEVILSRIIF